MNVTESVQETNKYTHLVKENKLLVDLSEFMAIEKKMSIFVFERKRIPIKSLSLMSQRL